jgi:hypothetical protein
LHCAVAADVRDLVAVYKNPPYPIFYDVVYHSYALVPMLASALYYSSKFSSTVLTSFITGVTGTGPDGVRLLDVQLALLSGQGAGGNGVHARSSSARDAQEQQ